MLELLVIYQENGLVTANGHKCILAMSHLYNALRQLKMLDQEWPLMDQVIELHKRALFAGEIPRESKEISIRLQYRLGIMENQRLHWKDNRKFELKEPTSTQMLRSLLDAELSADKVLWQIEQQVELLNSKKLASSPSTSSRVGHRQKEKTAPEEFIGSLREVTSQAVEYASIDYLRLSKRCLQLARDVRRMWKVQLQIKKKPLLETPFNLWDEANDSALIMVCTAILAEAQVSRETGAYSYRPGDGAPEASMGRSENLDDPERHGIGLQVASKVFKHFLAKNTDDFKLPLTSEVTSKVLPRAIPILVVCNMIYSADLGYLLSDTKYAVINFYANKEEEAIQSNATLAKLADEYFIPKILCFGQIHWDAAKDLPKKYCKKGATRHILGFFKDGKRFPVNGRDTIYGSDTAGWKGAIKKLGAEARKHVEQAKK